MKVGRNLPAIRRALAAAGKLGRAVYVERGDDGADADDCRWPRRPDDRGALFLAGAGAGLGGAAVSGRLDGGRARAGRAGAG